MRHLRLFESFGSYYEEIDPRGLADEKLMKPFVNLSKSDIDDISRWLVNSNLGDSWSIDDSTKLVTLTDYSNSQNQLKICKTEDDWFGVIFRKSSDKSMSSGKWFICDQISGVKELINDLEKR